MYIIAVIAWISFGIMIFFEPVAHWHFGVQTDFTGVNRILSPLFIFAGFYLFIKGRKMTKDHRKKEKEEWKKKKNHICPKCKRSYPFENESIEKCPKCKENLLLLEEFLKTI